MHPLQDTERKKGVRKSERDPEAAPNPYMLCDLTAYFHGITNRKLKKSMRDRAALQQGTTGCTKVKLNSWEQV